MQRIIDNLSRQHRELVRTGTEIFGWLDAGKLRGGAAQAYRAVATMSGILSVHLAMEDRSFYPRLIGHADRELSSLARRFLDERGLLEQRFRDYRAAWPSAMVIEGAPAGFVDDTRALLGLMWNRMKMEDDVLHPAIVRVFGADAD